MPFQIGQRVVCVRNDWLGTPYGEELPRKGRIYRIRWAGIMELRWWGLPDKPAVRLREIVNPPYDYINGHGEMAFDARGFRPIDERETDISIFTAMLSTTKSKVDA